MDLTTLQQHAQKAADLPFNLQAQEYFAVYREIEQFIREKKPYDLTVDKVRLDVKRAVNVDNLPQAFQLLFLDELRQLIKLCNAFLFAFTTSSALDTKINVNEFKESLTRKISLLSNALTEDKTLSIDIIMSNLQKVTEQDRQKELTSTLTEYLRLFYQRCTDLITSHKADTAVKKAYTQLCNEYHLLASKIFSLLPGEVLSSEERSKILLACYHELIDEIVQATNGDKKLNRHLIHLLSQVNKKDNLQKLSQEVGPFLTRASDEMKATIGNEATQSIFAKAYYQIREKYGVYPFFTEILTHVPRGILEIERYNMLSKDELEKVSRALKRTEVMKSEFTNIAAHELQTPLQPIIGYAKIIMSNKALNKKVRDQATIIYENGMMEKKLVLDLLDISKLEAGEMKFEMQDLDIHVLLKKAIASMSSTQRKVKIEPHFPKSIPLVYGDADRLTQVITNLIGNALKFTDKGSIIIKAKVTHQMITVSITDTGIGIKSEDLSRLFSKFVQSQDYRTRKTKGTGLGLAICKEIMLAHQGKIWGESKGIGKGSTFTFTLPVSERDNKLST